MYRISRIALICITTLLTLPVMATPSYHAYTEAFTGLDNNGDTARYEISGTFSMVDNALTDLGSTLKRTLNGADTTYTLFDVILETAGLQAFNFTPLQIHAHFIGLSGNENGFGSCAQVNLDGGGCKTVFNEENSLNLSYSQNPGRSGVFQQSDALVVTDVSDVPEPSVLALLAIGLLSVAALRGRNRSMYGYTA